MQTTYFGEIEFQLWEYLALPFLGVLIFLVSTRIVGRNRDKKEIYRFYLPGVFAKVVGGLIFGSIYIFYYPGGDTTAYYETSLAFCKLIQQSPVEGFQALFSEYSPEVVSRFDASTTGLPLRYIHSNISTFGVVRVVSLLMLLCYNSYILTTALIAWVSFFGVWRVYRLMASYYPVLATQLAWAFFFIPSVVFWGSGIAKDTITFSAASWLVVGVHNILIRPKKIAPNLIIAVVASYVLLLIKPYIFLGVMSGFQVWLVANQVGRIRNSVLRVVAVPLIFFVSIGIGLLAFWSLGDVLDDYALDRIASKASEAHYDLKQDYYGQNSFDIGDFEPTFAGILAKAPVALWYGMFSPFLWNVANIVMLFSALENTLLLILTVYVLFRLGPLNFFRHILGQPVVLFALSFSILFSIALGLTTANFGALVRFKIPMLPFYVTGLLILVHISRQKVRAKRRLKFAAPSTLRFSKV